MKINNVRTIKMASTFGIKKLYIAILILVVITSFSEGVNIFLSNRVSTDSIQASKLQKEIGILESQNNIIKAKVLEFASYDSVASRAAEFGFYQTQEPISLDTPVTVAQN